jgi:hypothetical protein
MDHVCTFLRETKGTCGRVYQIRIGDSRVAIDWKPVVPITGYDVFSRGEAVLHPTEGKVVYFPGARRRRGTTRIAVRTSARSDLAELFDLAIAMKSDLVAEMNIARRERGRSSTRAGAPAPGRGSQVVRLGLRVVNADGIK